LDKNIVDLGSGLEFSNIHELHQKGFLVLCEFLVLSTSSTLFGQFGKNGTGSIFDSFNESFSKYLLALPLLNSSSNQSSQLEVIDRVTILIHGYCRSD